MHLFMHFKGTLDSKQGKHSARKPPKLNILRISDGAHSEANNEMQYNAKLCDTMQYNALQ